MERQSAQPTVYHAAHGESHQEAQVWSMASCMCRTLNLIMDRDQVKSWLCVTTSARAQPMNRDQVWSTASYCVWCAHATWPWRQVKWEWKKILSCQLENFQGGSRELSSIHTGASLERKITHVWWCTAFHCASRVPSQTNVYSTWLSAEWHFERSSAFCCTWSAHAAWPMKTDQDQVWMETERLLLTWKNFKLVTENILLLTTIYELVAENLLFIQEPA